MAKLSFATLFAYDYEYLIKSIASYYKIADEIIIGIDDSNLSWKKKSYDMSNAESFFDKLDNLDNDRKVRWVKGNFHELDNPMHNETKERNVISSFCKNEWIVQIDADEVLLNPEEFAAYLETAPKDACIRATWESVFKKVGDKHLIIDGKKETTAVATTAKEGYVAGRGTKQGAIISPLRLLHFSWSRTEKELWQKLTNWGHADDFDTRKFFEFWKSINETNYQTARDFHPLDRVSWPALKLVELKDI